MLAKFIKLEKNRYGEDTEYPYETVYISNSLTNKEFIKKFEKLKDYFFEKSNGKVKVFILEDRENNKVKSYKFNANNYEQLELKEHYQNFKDMEWELKYQEPEIFMLKDLIGWNFINAFIPKEYNNRTFTFEKDGKIKQYHLYYSGEIRRNYNFTIGDTTYYEKDDHVWDTQYIGNIFEISQELKGEVVDITQGSDGFEIETTVGKLSYEAKYHNSSVSLHENTKDILICPYTNLENEVKFKVNYEIGKTIQIEFIKKRGETKVGTVYGMVSSNDFEEHKKLVECYTELTDRILTVINDSKDFKRLDFIYDPLDKIFVNFPEVDLSGLYLDFPKLKKERDERIKLKEKKEKEERIKLDKIIKENNYFEKFEINGVKFSLISYVSLYDKEYNYGKVKNIQLQLQFDDIYVQSCLDWNYHKKYFFFADIKVNSVHDKLTWGKKIFDSILRKLKKYLKVEDTFDNLVQGKNASHILGTIYQLDCMKDKDTWYAINNKLNKHDGFGNELSYNEVPKDKLA